MKRKFAAGCLAAATLLTVPAFAGRDNLYLGNGQDGTVTISISNTVVNGYAPVMAPLAAGDNQITIGTCTGTAGCPTAGRLIMVWQATGIVPEPASSATTTTNLTTNPVGRWELARVASVSGSTVTLAEPLVNSYAANVTQIVVVREYTSVSINPGRSITCPAWNGQTGGIVAFLVTGSLANGGSPGINAIGKGFRGGTSVNDASGSTGATGLDEPAPGGAQKGEGIAVSLFGPTQTGRGSVANGAGGGVAYLSGGGGGGNGGAGGTGGNSDLAMDGNRVVGGYGGGALTYNVMDHLVMGGGGAAGHVSSGSSAVGGAGGGVVFVRANALSGSGSMMTNGAIGGSTTGQDGASGGGAGGTLYLRLAGAAACGALQAVGGTAGSANGGSDVGPGGGGGGGRILFQKGSGTCTPTATAVNGGSAGVQQDAAAPGGSQYGATAGTSGSATTVSGGFLQLTASILTPAASSTTNNDLPPITGTATANNTVYLAIDGGTPVTVAADAGGNYSYTPASALADGPHSVQAYAYNATNAVYSVTTQTDFTVATSLPVELLSFTAAAEGSQVQLRWETAGEQNTDRYQVERSCDGQTFETIATVAAGNNGRRSYNAPDATPLPGLNLYRLRIVAQDGHSAYSSVARVTIQPSATVSVAPNPMHDRTTVTIRYAGSEKVQLVLTGTDGKVLDRYDVPLRAGAAVVELRRGSLAPGLYVYTLRTPSGAEPATGRLVIQ